MTLSCLFCPSQPLQPESDVENTPWHQCQRCQTHYVFREEQMMNYYFVHNRGQNYYQAIFNIKINRFSLHSNSGMILRFDFLPEINPSNFADKLLTLLVFS